MEHIAKSQNQIRFYELVVIVDPEATLDQQKAIFRRNRDIIESFGGSLHTIETWGRRFLANPIRKKRYGLYFHLMFQAKPAAIAELERVMRINDKVMRFMHVHLDERTPLSKHEERFKMALRESAEKEKERELKVQAKRHIQPQAP